ncbi:MAG: three-Cys-motif partner protein TcmP [Nanoarchaeota archaeon]|nr:three-Cys-motif partner protein TcmP [Nanoarchaeota archaeon]
MAAKLTGMEWLKKQILKLNDTNTHLKDRLAKICPDVYNEFQKWTPLKLILLNYTLDICMIIIDRTSIFKKKIYVDLFAGSGINKVKETNDFLIGSPLIAAQLADSFDKMFFCESDKDYNNALVQRLGLVGKKNIIIYDKDCNLVLDSIINEASTPYTYSLFFIDPFSTEFLWDSMQKVLQTRSDILFTFMSSNIWRMVGAARKEAKGIQVLNRLFGNDAWTKSNSVEELLQTYINNIQNVRRGAVIRTIKIQSKVFGSFYYHLIFITNITSGGNKWLQGIDKAKEEIEKNSDLTVEMALDIIKGRQKQLSHF